MALGRGGLEAGRPVWSRRDWIGGETGRGVKLGALHGGRVLWEGRRAAGLGLRGWVQVGRAGGHTCGSKCSLLLIVNLEISSVLCLVSQLSGVVSLFPGRNIPPSHVIFVPQISFREESPQWQWLLLICAVTAWELVEVAALQEVPLSIHLVRYGRPQRQLISFKPLFTKMHSLVVASLV